MYGLSPEWTLMWILSLLGVLHSLLHTLHMCLVLLGFLSPCFLWVHMTPLDFLFVDTTACVSDVLRFVFRIPDEDGTEAAAVLLVLKIICILSPGIPTTDNTKMHPSICMNVQCYTDILK